MMSRHPPPDGFLKRSLTRTTTMPSSSKNSHTSFASCAVDPPSTKSRTMSHTRSHCPRASPGRRSAFSRMRTVDLSGTGLLGCTTPHAAAMRATTAVASGRAAAASVYTPITSLLVCLASSPLRPTRSACRSSLSSSANDFMPASSVILIDLATPSYTSVNASAPASMTPSERATIVSSRTRLSMTCRNAAASSVVLARSFSAAAAAGFRANSASSSMTPTAAFKAAGVLAIGTHASSAGGSSASWCPSALASGFVADAMASAVVSDSTCALSRSFSAGFTSSSTPQRARSWRTLDSNSSRVSQPLPSMSKTSNCFLSRVALQSAVRSDT